MTDNCRRLGVLADKQCLHRDDASANPYHKSICFNGKVDFEPQKFMFSICSVLYGLILCMNPVTSNLSTCLRCGNNTLNQSKFKAQIMDVQAQDLFEAYVSEQELQPYISICDEPVQWLPTNLSKLPERKMLKEIYKALRNLGAAFDLIIEQQKQLNSEGTLIENLNRARKSIEGLRSNILCGLCTKKALPDPGGHMVLLSPSDIFQQKCEGCRVLKSYSKFIKEVAIGLKGLKKQGGQKQRRRKHKFTPSPLYYKTALLSFLSK